MMNRKVYSEEPFGLEFKRTMIQKTHVPHLGAFRFRFNSIIFQVSSDIYRFIIKFGSSSSLIGGIHGVNRLKKDATRERASQKRVVSSPMVVRSS